MRGFHDLESYCTDPSERKRALRNSTKILEVLEIEEERQDILFGCLSKGRTA